MTYAYVYVCLLFQKVKEVLSVCQRASDSNRLSESMYLKWVDVLKSVGHVDGISRVLTKATECYKTSCTAWLSRLAWEQQRDSSDIEAVFEQAVKNVPQRVRV